MKESLKVAPCLEIVVPCFNEEEVLPVTIACLKAVMRSLIKSKRVHAASRICFIDDGSSDNTWRLVCEAAETDMRIQGLKLSCNRGHQNALLAGLYESSADIVVSIDADLQDDVSVIEEMVDKYLEGHDIVYGVRESRDKDSFFKRVTAQGYYRLLQWMGVDLVYNHADFRLLSARVVSALRQYGEVNLFLRGIITTIGFPSTTVYYRRENRHAGESKYPLGKMLGLAWNGITSFSAVPLRMIAWLGFILFLFSLGISVWALWTKLFTDAAIPGWASSVLPIYLLGGIQLLSIGVLGEYVAKIYIETKSRPRYFIEKKAVTRPSLAESRSLRKYMPVPEEEFSSV